MAARLIVTVVSGVILGFLDAVCGLVKVAKLGAQRSEDGDTIASKVAEDSRALTELAQHQQERKEIHRPESRNTKPKIIRRLVQCCLLNGGVVMFSLLLFTHVLLPGLRLTLFKVLEGHASYIWTWLEPTLTLSFLFLWVMPIFIVTRCANWAWFLDIADEAYLKSGGRPQPQSISRIIVDSIFSCWVQVISLLQSQLVFLFPIEPIAQVLGTVHLSLLYSLYVFEYKWCCQGQDIFNLIITLEENWPYYIGFGMPLALMTSMSESGLIAACIFAMLFPFFIMSAMEADTKEHSRKVQPLYLFTPSLWVAEKVFNRCFGPISQKEQRSEAPAQRT